MERVYNQGSINFIADSHLDFGISLYKWNIQPDCDVREKVGVAKVRQNNLAPLLKLPFPSTHHCARKTEEYERNNQTDKQARRQRVNSVKRWTDEEEEQ